MLFSLSLFVPTTTKSKNPPQINWTTEKGEESKDENIYTLRLSAKTKYNISQQKELISTLTNLIISIENNEETNYHSLPELDELMNESGKLKTWTDYFPKREETHFGQKQEIEAQISREVWTILGRIFNDYAQTATRKERLETFSSEDEIMTELLLKGLTRLNTEALKKQGYYTKLKNWLKEYNLLEKSEQKDLAKQQKQIAQILAVLEESSKPEQQEQSWYQNIPWSKVLWYGGGGLLAILVISYLWKKFKE